MALSSAAGGADIHMSLQSLPEAEAALARLADAARADLAALSHPSSDWVRPVIDSSGRHVYEVVIVGAGQSGLVTGLSLKREGVGNVLLLDRNPAGYEGPWETFARMQVLRTPKALVGAELNIPNLSARAWFIARYGDAAWDAITWIPRQDWMRYLRWYRGVADLAIRNNAAVTGMAPRGDVIEVKTVEAGVAGTVLARRAVLATGQDGAGSWGVPPMIADALPARAYSQANMPIDLAALAGKRIGILGSGGSAFDAGLAALQAGAASVDICFRRALLPVVNPHRWLDCSARLAHFHDLPDAIRWNIGRHFDAVDQPPPRHTFERARAEPRLRVHGDCPWRRVAWTGKAVEIATDRQTFEFDFVISATGLFYGLEQRPELAGIVDKIGLWADRYAPPPDEGHPELGKLPYLGPHFEFLEKHPGAAPWLSRIHAFNFSGFLSMGPVTTGITGQRYGVPRLVRGITASLFLEQSDSVLPSLYGHDEPEIDPAAATLYAPPSLSAEAAQ